jgi:hypothetical protein
MKKGTKSNLSVRIVKGNLRRLEKQSPSMVAQAIKSQIEHLGKTERHRLLTETRQMLENSGVKYSLSSQSVYKILSAMAFWQYVCSEYAMTLLFDIHSRTEAQKTLSKLSGMRQDQILAVVDTWDT